MKFMNKNASSSGLVAGLRTLKFRLVPVLFLGMLLAACGGGSSDSEPSATFPIQGAVAPPVSTTPSIVTSVSPTLPYPAGSEELEAYTLLNAERDRCGFGLLAKNLSLDAAAKAHADYQIINFVSSHLENASQYPEGFTGNDPDARVKAQGYADLGEVTDEFAFFTSSSPVQSKLGIGKLGIRALLNAPYHLNGLMSGYRDVGIAVRSNEDTGRGARGVLLQINAAFTKSAGPQLLGNSAVQTYPCEGATGVNRQLTNETPNPVPGRDLSTSPLGSTVYVGVREGNRLTITGAAMTHSATGVSVALRAPITSANDPYGPCQSGCFKTHQAYVVPDAPLAPNTRYTVMISGTNNSTPFSRTFSFETGS